MEVETNEYRENRLAAMAELESSVSGRTGAPTRMTIS